MWWRMFGNPSSLCLVVVMIGRPSGPSVTLVCSTTCSPSAFVSQGAWSIEEDEEVCAGGTLGGPWLEKVINAASEDAFAVSAMISLTSAIVNLVGAGEFERLLMKTISETLSRDLLTGLRSLPVG